MKDILKRRGSMNTNIRKLPVGVESFEKIQKENFYYIDKTGLICELLHKWSEVTLFTRPRRFGKSLNMSMLKAFFEIGGSPELFDGLKISKETDICKNYMGKFPVISVSLKDVDGEDFSSAFDMMCLVTGREAMRFQFLLESDKLTEKEKQMYEQLTSIDKSSVFQMSETVLAGGLRTLSQLLCKHYGRKVIILIDEYDVPLAKANEKGYYDQMVTLLHKMFSQALKTNESLYFAVLTGCLRISKESVFTGLNNLKVLTVADVQFDEYFGFTNQEVQSLLEYYKLSHSYEMIKDWYDGYRFGAVDVYCPWDVICYCDRLREDKTATPGNYWSNTSGNDIVKRFISMTDASAARGEVERLIAGEAVTKEIHQELTYKELYDSIDNVWSILFTTGYLTQRGKSGNDLFQLVIPNREIRKIFTGQIMKLFRENTQKDGTAVNAFCEALLSGNAENVEKQFTEYLAKTISIRDTFVRKPTKENFYHGILLGILSFKSSWIVNSNQESGDGYSDIQIEIDEAETGIIIEVKYAHNANLESECQKALAQIESLDYVRHFREEGFHVVLKYGIACYKKRCRVALERSVL